PIEFADGFELFVLVGRHQRIEGAGLANWAVSTIRMSVVIQQLIFVADGTPAIITHIELRARRILALYDEVLNPAVAASGDAPVEHEIEIGELVGCKNIVAGPTVALRTLDALVRDGPDIGGDASRSISAPTAERLAVKDQFPSFFLLGIGQS